MKRTLIAAALLLLLPVAALGAAARSVGGQAEQVVLTPTVLYGDPAAAQGLTVQLHSQYQDRLYWDTTYTVGTPGQAWTDVQFHSSGLGWADQGDRPLIWVGLDDRLTIPPGDPRLKGTQLLRDYISYYSIRINIDLPEGEVPETETAPVNQALSDFLRIPVLEDEAVTLARDTFSGEDGWRYTALPSSDSFALSARTAQGADACYFTFNPRSAQGRPMDTGHIPGGYGIYRLPYTLPPDGGAPEIHADQLELVCPLDPAVEVHQLSLSADEGRLLIYTLEQGSLVLNTVSLPDGTALDRLEICPWTGEGQIWEQPGFLAVQNGETMTVVDLSDAQHCRTAWSIPYPELSWNPWADRLQGSLTAALAFDGTRLAVADWDCLETEPQCTGCGFALAVYDASGLRCKLRYVSSLDGAVLPDPMDTQRPQPARAAFDPPLSLSWQTPTEGGA